MIKTRKTRIAVLTVWALLVCLIFFSFHGRGGDSVPGKFISELEESVRLQPETAKEQEQTSGSGKGHDLTSASNEVFNAEKEYRAILAEGPVVIFSKSYCPHSKAAKDLLLEQYEVMPKPIVVELDKHPHGKELQEYIGEKTGRSTVPNVHVKGLSRGGNDDFQVWNREGLLSDKFKQWAGSVVSIQKRPTPPGT